MIHDITPGRNLEHGMWNYQQRLEELVGVRTSEAEARRRNVIVLLVGLLIVSALAVFLVLSIGRLKRTEAKLSVSEALYRSLFQSNPHPMWVYDLQTFRFLAANNAAVSHYGYSRDEFLSMTIKDIRPPEDLLRLYKNLEELPEQGVDNAGVWRHYKKDGSLIDVEITSHVLEFDRRRSELVLALDITARRKSEERLRESEERLRLSTELAHVAVWDYHVPTDRMSRSKNHDALYGLPWQDNSETNTFFNAICSDGGALAPDPERARQMLEQLAPLLASDDTAAGDLFESSRQLLLATHGTAALRLGRQVAAFDYPGALATVRSLLGRGPRDTGQVLTYRNSAINSKPEVDR